MDRFLRAALIWVLLVSSPTTTVETFAGEDPPSPESKRRVDQVLAEWHAKASSHRTIEVKFRQEDRSKFGSISTKARRAILASPHLGFLETSSVDDKARPVEILSRIIWNDQSVLFFDMAEQEVNRYANLRESSRLPAELRLPFLFDMTLDEVKRDYDWALLREEGDLILLGATGRAETRSAQGQRTTIIELSRTDFLPKRVFYRDVATGEQVRIEAKEIKLNAFTDLEGLASPCLDAWTVTERNGRFLRPFLQ
jgi:hypothetical protein